MPNQFNKPAGMVVDDMGSLIVVDSGNNRLQVVDSNWNICGALKVNINICIKTDFYPEQLIFKFIFVVWVVVGILPS